MVSARGSDFDCESSERMSPDLGHVRPVRRKHNMRLVG
jgi:hypothetical protein